MSEAANLGPGGRLDAGARDDWRTPRDLFEELDSEFRFTVDAAASAGNALCERYWDEEADGLAQDWGGETVFCNPPFNGLPAWMGKARREADAGATVVVVCPARIDALYWAEAAVRSELRFWWGGRVAFDDAEPAPFVACLVVMRPDDLRPAPGELRFPFWRRWPRPQRETGGVRIRRVETPEQAEELRWRRAASWARGQSLGPQMDGDEARRIEALRDRILEIGEDAAWREYEAGRRPSSG